MAQPLAREKLQWIFPHGAGGKEREVFASRGKLHITPVQEIGEAAPVRQPEARVQRRRAQIGVNQERPLAHGGEALRELGGERRAPVARAQADERQQRPPRRKPMLQQLGAERTQRFRARGPCRQQRVADGR